MEMANESQEDLAGALCRPQSTISDYERGKSNPDIDFLKDFYHHYTILQTYPFGVFMDIIKDEECINFIQILLNT